MVLVSNVVKKNDVSTHKSAKREKKTRYLAFRRRGLRWKGVRGRVSGRRVLRGKVGRRRGEGCLAGEMKKLKKKKTKHFKNK